MALYLLIRYGRFPGEYFSLPAGERAVICAGLVRHERNREEV